MPVVIRSITEIEQADDVAFGTLGPAKDGYSVTYDDGTSKFVLSGISASPSGADTQVQFNDSGSFGGDAGFTYNKTTDVATLVGGLVAPKVYPASNSTTAFQINKADGTTNVVNVDTTNSRVGIGTTAPLGALQVDKDIVDYGNSATFGHLELQLATLVEGNTKRLSLGFSSLYDSGFIQAIHSNKAYKTLQLNPFGGNIGIGMGTNPSLFPLEIEGNNSGNNIDSLGINNRGGANGTSASFAFRLGGSTYAKVRGYYDSGGFLGLRSNGANDMVVLDPSGYFGVGVTAPTAFFDVAASTTAASSIRIRSGTAPSSPNEGDLWYDGTNLMFRDSSTTRTITWT